MLIVQPSGVTYGGKVLEHVASVRVDMRSVKTVTEWDDSGPFVRLCDVVQQETRVIVSVQLFAGDVVAEVAGNPGNSSVAGLVLGSEGVLRVTTANNASDAGRKTLRVERAVLVGVRHELARAGRGGGEAIAPVATRELEFVCVSESGGNPVEVV